MSIHDYLIDHRDFDWAQLFLRWEWLLPAEVTVWLMNRFGDLFLILPDGSVQMLDIGAGSLTKMAESKDEFSRLIDEGSNADDWLMIPLVDRLVVAGIHLQPGQCYSLLIPPLLGGSYTIEAPDYEQAVKHTLDHPHLDYGGTIEVRQIFAM